MNIRLDNSENVCYAWEDFPVYARKGKLSYYPNYAAACHWHDDVEFISVLSGEMLYNVDGKIIRISKGEGIFVNSRRLHYGFSETRDECEFICVLFHPMILCAVNLIEEKYVDPILKDPDSAYLHIGSDSEWGIAVLNNMERIYNAVAEKTCPRSFSELEIEAACFEIWLKIFEQTDTFSKKNSGTTSYTGLVALKNMITYIQTHYADKITLAELAQAGAVSKTGCFNIFKKYVNQSPNAYIINYRLKKSIELMSYTDKSIAEICYDVGFSSASYYGKIFRRVYGAAPLAFRKNLAQS